MRIVVDGLFRGLLGGLAAPPVPVREEEQLLLGEMAQSRQMQVRGRVVVLLPRMEGGSESTGVGNVLPQREASIHVENLASRAFHGELGVLVDEALGPFFEGLHGPRIPPVRVVADFIVVPTGGIEG